VLAEPLKNDPKAISGWNAARYEIVAQVTGGKLIVRSAIRALHRNACHRLIPLERDLARHGNQVEWSSWCLCEGCGCESGNYGECKKTHDLTVHGPHRPKEECG
jgi:hypothetical protein